MNIFLFKQKTAYEMRISDWSSDVCSSDLHQYRPKDGTGYQGRHQHILLLKKTGKHQEERDRYSVTAKKASGYFQPAPEWGFGQVFLIGRHGSENKDFKTN